MAIRIGVDYYPEQWDEALWEKDANTMSLAWNLTVICSIIIIVCERRYYGFL